MRTYTSTRSTRPEWFREIEEKLVPTEPGLFRLRRDLEKEVDRWLSGPTSSASHDTAVPFLLDVETSSSSELRSENWPAAS